MIDINSYEAVLQNAGIHIENAMRFDNGRDIHYEFLSHTDAAKAMFILLAISKWEDCPNIELYGSILNINSNESNNSGLQHTISVR